MIAAMKPVHHVKLLLQGVFVWAAFWVAGLPSYYQQYSSLAMGVGCTILSVAISLAALYVLSRARAETRMSRALWISFYYTVPFAVLDTLYCGVYLQHGASYLHKYWYLTVFYLTPWLTFPPTAWLLRDLRRKPR
jgi:ABC-type glycerol-3-phosphate transport system permease component